MSRNSLGFLVVVAALGLALPAAHATDASNNELSIVEQWEADRTTFFDASEVDLDALQWIARPVIIFADTPADPAFQRQIELLEARIGEMEDRDVILITDTSREDPSALRTKLRPRGFMLTLIGKDGGVKLRKPFPWDVRELSRSIDKMPLRQQELRDRANALSE